jgi:hypothetical protein
MINKPDWEQFLHQAQVKLTGASEAGIKGEFYDVLSEFLNDTSIWTHDVTVPYQTNVISYPLFVPEGQMIRLSGALDWGPSIPTETTIAPNGTSFVPALMPKIGTLVLKNPPNNTGYLQVTLVVNTSLPTDRHMIPVAPHWLLPIWHTGLLDGLLGKMMTTPNKSYSDKGQGAYHLRRFRDAITRARTSKLRANTNGASAWRFPQQFRSLSQQSGVPAIGSANERSF